MSSKQMSSTAVADDEFPEHGAQRTLTGMALMILMTIALTFSIYQLVIAGFSPLSSLTMRSLHVGFLLALTFLIFPAFKTGKLTSVVWYDWILAGTGFILSFYHWIFESDLIVRAGDPNTADLVVGTIMVVMVFEATRRMLGWALPIV